MADSLETPAGTTHVRLVYRLLDAVGDTSDPDVMPDFQALPQGSTLTITYPVARIINPVANPPVTFYPRPIVCTFSASGLLLDPDGNEGVWVVDPRNESLQPHGYTLTATINIPGRMPESFVVGFNSPAPDGSYDLSLNMPVPAAPATAVTIGPPGHPLNLLPAVADAASLPTEGNVQSDFRVTLDSGEGWGWDGDQWVSLGLMRNQPLDLTVDKVTTGPPNSDAKVTLVDGKLSFVIPAGNPGTAGFAAQFMLGGI